ncbi:MAG: M3 family metallopeptidase [Legionellaceae bacterium]|nr:M3 family metallopeptidase [Legionellaceae bacterium]
MPIAASQQIPAFDTIDYATFPADLERLLQAHLHKISTILAQNTPLDWEHLMQPLEEMEDELERIWAPVSHLHGVLDSEAVRQCYERCLPHLSAYDSAIGQNYQLYQAISSIDAQNLNTVQKKIISDRLLAFELAGVHLSPEKKQRFEKIQAKLSELSNRFENNLLDATHDFSLYLPDDKRLAGLPDHSLQRARELAMAENKPGFLLNLEFPCYYAIVTYAEDRQLRETFYHAYITRASDTGPSAGRFDNGPVINDILHLRHETAQLLGFANFAEYSLASKMAESTEEVMHFLEGLCNRARHQAVVEFEQLADFARQSCAIAPLMPWDIAFVSEKKRQERFHLSQEALRQWFPLSTVLAGLFTMIQRLYGLRVHNIQDAQGWHPDVQCYQIYDDNHKLRGTIFADFFARSNKRGGAWMDSLQSRRKHPDGSIQEPVATLNCNFANPTEPSEAYLSHDEVLTLFHEFGHCLHHILTQVDYISVSGIHGVEWDAVELPSQFFENWCWDHTALQLLTQQAETGEPLPYTWYERLLASKNFQSAMAMMRQLEFSLFDFRLHRDFRPGDERAVDTILADVRQKTSVTPPAAYNRFPQSFSHIFGGGYAAGYYSYKWAEVLSSDAFSRFEEEGIFNAQTGRDFLHCILETGGSQKAIEAFMAFRGRLPTHDALLKHNGIQ